MTAIEKLPAASREERKKGFDAFQRKGCTTYEKPFAEKIPEAEAHHRPVRGQRAERPDIKKAPRGTVHWTITGAGIKEHTRRTWFQAGRNHCIVLPKV